MTKEDTLVMQEMRVTRPVTFEVEAMNPPKQTNTTPAVKQFSESERKQIVAECKADGFDHGAIVCRIRNGVPETQKSARGYITWVYEYQMHNQPYAPLEVRWLGIGEQTSKEKLWPADLFLIQPPINEDVLKNRVEEWKRNRAS